MLKTPSILSRCKGNIASLCIISPNAGADILEQAPIPWSPVDYSSGKIQSCPLARLLQV
jgi:hypothetical protein